VIALTKAMGKELANTEIRVNAIAPAVIATELIKLMSEATFKAVVAKIPIGRTGRPEEVAALVAWLGMLVFDRRNVRSVGWQGYVLNGRASGTRIPIKHQPWRFFFFFFFLNEDCAGRKLAGCACPAWAALSPYRVFFSKSGSLPNFGAPAP
jgi:hypothetical protein